MSENVNVSASENVREREKESGSGSGSETRYAIPPIQRDKMINNEQRQLVLHCHVDLQVDRKRHPNRGPWEKRL